MVEVSDNVKKIVNGNETSFTKFRQKKKFYLVTAAKKVKRSKKKISFILVFLYRNFFFPLFKLWVKTTFQDSRTYLYIKILDA